VPKADIIALLVNPTSQVITETISTDLASAASVLGLQLHILRASTKHDFDPVFQTFAELKAGALVIAPDAAVKVRSGSFAARTLVTTTVMAVTSTPSRTSHDLCGISAQTVRPRARRA
jgi:putative ABC transport system substrate-binding protein